MTLCHDVLVTSLPDKSGEMTMQKSGASQDELCFLNMVEEKGIA
jgi:hypothetical protein